MTDADLIRTVGQTLWGDRWQTDMTRALGLADSSTVRKWARGAQSPRPGVWSDLRAMLEARAESVNQAASLVGERLGG